MWLVGKLSSKHVNIPSPVLCLSVAELLFLLWGVYLCYAVRTVPSAFHEPRYMAVAIYNELLISAIFHIIRWVCVRSLLEVHSRL